MAQIIWYWLLSAYHAATNKLAKSMLLTCDSLIGMSDQSRIFIDPYIGLSRLMKLWSRKFLYCHSLSSRKAFQLMVSEMCTKY